MDIWANQLLPKALKSCPKSKKLPNLVTLSTTSKNEEKGFKRKQKWRLIQLESVRIVHQLHSYLPTYQYTCLPVYLPTYQYTYLPAILPTCISTYLYIYLPVYLPTCISTYQYTYLPVYLPTCKSTYVHKYLPSYLEWSFPIAELAILQNTDLLSTVYHHMKINKHQSSKLKQKPLQFCRDIMFITYWSIYQVSQSIYSINYYSILHQPV